MFRHSLPFCLCDLNGYLLSHSLGHALRQFIHQADVTVVDAYLLRCCAGVFLRTLSDFYRLMKMCRISEVSSGISLYRLAFSMNRAMLELESFSS